MKLVLFIFQSIIIIIRALFFLLLISLFLTSNLQKKTPGNGMEINVIDNNINILLMSTIIYNQYH